MFTEKRFYSGKFPGEYLDYLFYQPDTGEKLPLVINIQGAGARGDDIQLLYGGGMIRALLEKGQIHARVINPQCRLETWFDHYHVLCDFIESNIADPQIDPSRVYISGSSMGAYTVWQLCISHPQWFAAAVPVCGGGMYWDAGRLKDIPVWAFHGAKDDVVLCRESQIMVDRINQAGGNAKLTIFPEADHNAWDPAYHCEEMWQWLFRQKRGE